MFQLVTELKHFAPNLPDSAAHKTLTFLFETGRLPNLPDSSHHKKRPKRWDTELRGVVAKAGNREDSGVHGGY